MSTSVEAAFDFNYRQRLIGTAIKHCNSPDKDVRAPLVAGLQEMVGSDQRLEGSKEAVLAIGRLAQGMAGRKAKAARAEERRFLARLLSNIIFFPLRALVFLGCHDTGHSDRGSNRRRISLKDPQTNGQAHRGLHYELLQAETLHSRRNTVRAIRGDMSNADEDVKKGLAEASITLSAEQLRKREGELLYEVFVVYLRILRQRHLHSRELMGTVLTGLARWGQQVNLELLLEILSELRLAVKDGLGRQFRGLLFELDGWSMSLPQDAIARADELVALHGQALLTDVSWLSDSMTDALALALPSMYSVHSEDRVLPASHLHMKMPDQARLKTASDWLDCYVRLREVLMPGEGHVTWHLEEPFGATRWQANGLHWSSALQHTRQEGRLEVQAVESFAQDWCFAYYLANSLDIQALTDNWKASLRRLPHTSPRPVIRFHSDVALLKVDEKDCFVFSFGCLVCWGCTPQEVQAARESVRNFLKEPLSPVQIEVDHLNIAGGDALPVCHKAQERIAIAYSLAQSVRLSYWEQRIDEWIAATRTIPEDMARTGRVLLSSRRVAKMMGELFTLKNQVNLEFDTLDTPDVFWEFEEAEPIYVYARQHLDVDRRINIVNQRFEVLEDMFDVLQDKLDERQGNRLTWIIIWLCALETVFSALKIIWTAGLLPAVQNAEHWLVDRIPWPNGTPTSNATHFSASVSLQERQFSLQEAPRDHLLVLPILGTLDLILHHAKLLAKSCLNWVQA
ncbi:RMD1 [Symbiodinium natans]|uniref:RMD1 protein n=1 Tax=Symbiodinium natans TaxID=878477 RepID=A0A812MWI9_9DINO|nr:RMD1 [Symbiodinium natans]